MESGKLLRLCSARSVARPPQALKWEALVVGDCRNGEFPRLLRTAGASMEQNGETKDTKWNGGWESATYLYVYLSCMPGGCALFKLGLGLQEICENCVV